jgi:diguanylate cyclase
MLIVASTFIVLRMKRTKTAKRGPWFQLGGAVLIGIYATGLTFYSFEWMPGLTFDLRSVPLLLYAYLQGWKRGLIAAAVPSGVRLYFGMGDPIVDLVVGLGLPALIGGCFSARNPTRGTLFQVIRVSDALLMTISFYLIHAIFLSLRAGAPPADAIALSASLLLGGSATSLFMALALNDDSKTQLSRRELNRLARTDLKTGIYNYSYATEKAETWRAEGRPFRVVLLDIDFFKAYNDTHGHLEGDELLKRFAAILQSEAGPADLVARFGGEEFLILVRGSEDGYARELAERVRRKVEDYPFLGRERQPGGRVTVSLGISRVGADLKKSMLEADRALYESKRTGRNRVSIA